MSKLLIVESPGKLASLRKYLGAGWEVAASVGHIRDLPQRDMGIAEDFSLQYELTERGAEVAKKLKALVKQVDEVYLATDPDREGEAIAWHLQQVLGLKNPPRVKFSEIQPQAVKNAVANPGKIDMALVHAQEARRALDRLAGFTGSPAVSRASGRNGLSVGRVQSPAVRLLVDRERAIRAFKSTDHFGVQLTFPGDWAADWRTKPHLSDGALYITDKNFAEQVSAVRDVLVESIVERKARRAPPAPFTTSTMQQAAAIQMNLSTDTTMSLAQALYEAGYITYHRTDKPCLSDESFASLSAYAKGEGMTLVSKMRTWPSKAGAQEAHEAIRPTNWGLKSVPCQGKITETAAQLYEFIRMRAIASQLPDAIYDERVAVLKAASPVAGKTIYFDATGRKLCDHGWLAFMSGDQTDEEGPAQAKNPVPQMAQGQTLTAASGKLQAKKTEAPKRFNEASLLKELERLGIGRPATYASILGVIQKRGYVNIQKKAWLPTELAEALIDMICPALSVSEFSFTSDMENELDLIAEGKQSYTKVVSDFAALLDKEIKNIKPVALGAGGGSGGSGASHPCEKCGKPMYQRKGKNGPFWGCSGYPACNHTLPDEKGKPLTAETAKHVCPDCGKPLVRRQKKGVYDFWGCTGYPACKSSFENDKNKPDLKKKK